MNNIQIWGAGAAAFVAAMAFSKFLPTQKIGDKIFDFMKNIGSVVSKALLRYLPAKSAERIETGIINSILYWIEMCVKGFRIGMLEDNVHHRQKKGKI